MLRQSVFPTYRKSIECPSDENLSYNHHRFSWIFIDFLRFQLIFFIMWSKWLKIGKAMFYVFCLFTSLRGRFRLSPVSQTIDLEEIYRLVSKILNFMACGSVLGRFFVSCKSFVGSASKFDRDPIEILSKF